ncbi:IPT/TIG domain-containing protein [Winogradskya consettensis]|uniref:IPT/TIG domain-containing protein n=1 Tax=Winogradskya consettensis TaxID=113560 RepID=UPI001BB3AC8E|nr:IPT/TIG domain-containing protein [Actinoplanes consettensis]
MTLNDPAQQFAARTPLKSLASIASVSAEAGLASLGVTSSGSVSALAPGFSPANHYYQAITDSPALTVTPVAADLGATVEVRLEGALQTPANNGSVALSLSRGRNEVTIKVTASNSSTTDTYHLAAWFNVAPQAKIVGITGTTTTVYGGTRSTVTLRDGTFPGYPWCYRVGAEVASGSASVIGSTLDPDTGLTQVVLELPEAVDHKPGISDLKLSTYCSIGNFYGMESRTTLSNAYTFTDDFQITSADIPDPVTSGSVIVLRGHGVVSPADVVYWIKDAQGRILDDVYWWGWTGDDNATIYVEYPDGEAFGGSGPRTLYAGACPTRSYRYNSDCVPIWSRSINWRAPAPLDLSFTPSAGPVAGGTKIRLKGRFLVSGEDEATIKVGGVDVPDYDVVHEGWDGDTFEQYTQDYDTIEFPAPPAAAAGPVKITATNPYGSATTAASFTYAARPGITSISPTTVATSGGSVITVQGTDFGTTGRPTVIIGGIKSPLVTRVSNTKLTAVVPAAQTPGPVAVQVSSAQGGGISESASLTLAAPGAAPVISQVSPASAKAGDEVTVTGTGFGATGTAGVSVDGVWARVTASSATSLTFEVPAVDTVGAKDLVVGAVTGAVTRAGGITVLPENGISSVSPAVLPSYNTGSAAKITITGAGFGTAGTVKVGTAAAVSYTATSGGTVISGVSVPTGAAGSLPVVVTPSGSSTALRSSVRVTGPAITYVGPEPYNAFFLPPSQDEYDSGLVLQGPTTGGMKVRIQGSGFGPAGTLRVGSTTVTALSWSDTAITFLAPAMPVGSASVTVAPTGSSLSATQAVALLYTASLGLPTIDRISSTTDLSHSFRNEFDPVGDLNDAFTLTGTNLTGTAAASTRVIVEDQGGGNDVTLAPSAVTETSLTFPAPRGFSNGGWKRVTVVTDVGRAYTTTGVLYLNAGVTLTRTPDFGSCLRTAQPATGNVTQSPAVVTITNSGGLFGSAGTVTIDGVTIVPTSYADGQIVVDLAALPTDLSNPWGAKTFVITPSDSGKAVQRVGFVCGLASSVTTTANGSANQLTIPAGQSYTLGNTTSGFIGANPFVVTAPSGYEYVTAATYGLHGFTTGATAGAPVAAGDYYVRVARNRATYAAERYVWLNDPAPVQVTITGTPITLTPMSATGASFTYRGQLNDGTDFTVTPSSTTDPITKVVWEYRNSTCDQRPLTDGWTEGLPGNVALADPNCGGDGVSTAAWDVRVKSFEMKTSGTDRGIYYVADKPVTRITITPRDLTIGAVRADKVYDGTEAVTLGELTFTGAVDGDSISLVGNSGSGTFADATPGVNKPVTLADDVALAGSAKTNYVLTNPRPTVTGTIAKADAVLALSVSPKSVLLTENTPVEVTATVTDKRTNAAPNPGAALAQVVLTSQTPAICTIAGTTVTASSAGTCVITGRQASSVNYNVATAASDPAETVETIEVSVFGAPQTIAVVADDLTVPVGDDIAPTAQITGLFDGDEVSGVDYDYYQGNQVLNGAPTDPGTYKIVPRGGSLNAANDSAYSNPTSFQYVAGSLVITPVPPEITRISPAIGVVSGGTTVTITGNRLDTVRSVRIGDTVLRIPDFQVNGDGTSLTFRTPAVSAPDVVTVTLVAGTAEASATYSYIADPTPIPDPPAPPVTPTPAPPSALTAAPVARAGTSSISVSWQAVTGQVTGYTAYASPGQATCTTTAPATSCVIGGVAGTSYTVTVVASGPGGASGPSLASNAVVPTEPETPATVPTDVPLTLTTDKGKLSLAVPSQQIIVIGTGFAPFSTATVTIYSTPIELGQVTTDSNGDFAAPVTVPAGLAAGEHTFLAVGVDPAGAPRKMALPVTVAPTSPGSSGTGDTTQKTVLPVPSGGGITLLDASGNPATTVTVAGQGTYALDATTGTISFVPVKGFSGKADPVSYRITDAIGTMITGTYTAVVTKSSTDNPGPGPSTGTVKVNVAKLTVTRGQPAKATFPVVVSFSTAVKGRNSVVLWSTVSGKRVVVGAGRSTMAKATRRAAVPITLNALGRALAARLGGYPVAVAVTTTPTTGRTLRASSRTNLVLNAFTAARPVYFTTSSSVVSAAQRRYLTGLRAKLTGVASITCVGHTDDRGNAKASRKLGERRAAEVCRLLTARLKIKTSVITRGEANPSASNKTPAGMARNRRADITIRY